MAKANFKRQKLKLKTTYAIAKEAATIPFAVTWFGLAGYPPMHFRIITFLV